MTSASLRLARSYSTLTPISSMPRGMSVGGATSVTSMPSIWKPMMSLRATRLCRMSPMMETLRPSRSRPRFWRMLKRSSRHCVGCWCLPSPALMTLASVLAESVWQAPADGWRMTMMSGE